MRLRKKLRGPRSQFNHYSNRMVKMALGLKYGERNAAKARTDGHPSEPTQEVDDPLRGSPVSDDSDAGRVDDLSVVRDGLREDGSHHHDTDYEC